MEKSTGFNNEDFLQFYSKRLPCNRRINSTAYKVILDAAANIFDISQNDVLYFTLRKHAHAIYRFFTSKNLKFHKKNFDIFLIFAQNINCGYSLEPPRRGGSNVYPQSMF